MQINKPFTRFLLSTSFLYILWFGLYEFVLKPNGRIDHIITENISIIVCYLLNLSDYNSYYTIGQSYGETYIFIQQQISPIVKIGSSCNGLEMLMIFGIFILCYPGNWFLKGGFIFIGGFVIHILNIFRNYVLTLLAIQQSQYFQLFHRYVFILLIYGIIFLLWMYWANSLSKRITIWQ